MGETEAPIFVVVGVGNGVSSARHKLVAVHELTPIIYSNRDRSCFCVSSVLDGEVLMMNHVSHRRIFARAGYRVAVIARRAHSIQPIVDSIIQDGGEVRLTSFEVR